MLYYQIFANTGHNGPETTRLLFKNSNRRKMLQDMKQNAWDWALISGIKIVEGSQAKGFYRFADGSKIWLGEYMSHCAVVWAEG